MPSPDPTSAGSGGHSSGNPPVSERAARARRQEEHLRTDHLLKNLGGRAASGGVVTMIAQVLRFGLNIGSAIVLARLLTPEDFGLVTIVGALTGFLRMFKDAGLSTATVQKDQITHAQVSNLFWINLALGAVLTLLLSALAPAVAWFYKDPRLFWITLWLSLSFLLGGSTVQHTAILNRQMRFKAIMMIDIATMVISLVVGVAMAMTGWGYWALVGSQLALSVSEVVLTWTASKWRPQLPERGQDTRGLLNFGASLTLSNFVRRLTAGADVLLIGKFYGTDAVGLYSRALALLMRPLDHFINPFDVVFVPLLSRLQKEPARYRKTFLQAYGTIALLSFPFAGLLLALARPIILLLLGPRWESVTPIFAWFGLAAVYIPLGYAAMWLLTTQGRSNDILVAGFSFSGISVASVSLGLFWGPIGVACAFSLCGLFVRIPFQYYITGRSGPVSARDMWGVFLRHLPTFAAAYAGAAAALMMVATSSPMVQLLVAGPAGLLAAGVVVALMPSQRREVADLKEMADRIRQRRAGKAGASNV